MTGPAIRRGGPADIDDVLDLWRRANALPTVTDSHGALGALLAADPQALLVADASGDLVGSLIAAWNGWRGSLYRLAVDPDHRRRGIATALLQEGESSLRRRGAARVDAIAAAGDDLAMAFWSAAGYEHQPGHSRFVRTF